MEDGIFTKVKTGLGTAPLSELPEGTLLTPATGDAYKGLGTAPLSAIPRAATQNGDKEDRGLGVPPLKLPDPPPPPPPADKKEK